MPFYLHLLQFLRGVFLCLLWFKQVVAVSAVVEQVVVVPAAEE